MNPLKDPRFLKRLRLYGFGFLVGTLFVVFLFKDRFPESVDGEKLRESFKEDSLVLAPQAERKLDSLGLSVKSFQDSLLQGDFTLPEDQREDRHGFFILTEGVPPMKVRMEVLEEGRTRAEWIRFP